MYFLARTDAAANHHEVCGQRVSAQQYHQCLRLHKAFGKWDRKSVPERLALEAEFRRDLLSQADRLPLLAPLILHQEPFMPPALVADILASDWLSPRFAWSTSEVLRQFHLLPLATQALLHTQLRSRLEEAPAERQDDLSALFTRLAVLDQLKRDADAAALPVERAADAFVALFIEQTRQGKFSLHPWSRSSVTLPRPELFSVVYPRLLDLRIEDHPLEADASDYARNLYTGTWTHHLQAVLNGLLRAPMTDEDVDLGLERLVADCWTPLNRENMDYVQILQQLARQAAERGRLAWAVLAAARRSAVSSSPTEHLGWALAAESPELNVGEPWAEFALAELERATPDVRQAWRQVLEHARSATGGKPSAKWLAEARTRLSPLGDSFAASLPSWLDLLGRSRTRPLRLEEYQPNPNHLFDTYNALVLKGLLWMVPLAPSDALTRSVARVVDVALKKAPGVGPRAPKIANAAVYALSQLSGELALASLGRLATSVTYKGTLKEIQKALNELATRLNVTADELLELSVPSLGLQDVGVRAETFGDVEVRLTVDAFGAQLTWTKGGKVIKAVPASVKRDFKEELAELKTAQADAEGLVTSLRDRLDALMIQDRTWTGHLWRERYLDHPLTGTLARRLIWRVDGEAVCWTAGALRSLDGTEQAVSGTAEVRLWHPLQGTVEEVLAWRDRLEAHGVLQPFKQAWREIYVLTDAERRTATYSNRFAAHILKQHQFHALAALRGWQNRLRLMVDDQYPPATRDLPSSGLRAEFWIEGVGENYETDANASGSYLRLKTDQVRFYPLGAPVNWVHASGGGYTQYVAQDQTPTAPLPLTEIPPLVLSEILRDVDLFVGVASVGNDPTWQDGGPEGRYREYWQSYSFGELTTTAETRKAMLTRLLPKLKIAERLSLDGRFLRVRGDIRSYKIHLGSGNILMEPNDQYLCIVPSSGAASGSGVQVPFDGDRVLSVILSKALMLAADTQITDQTIISQISRKRG